MRSIPNKLSALICGIMGFLLLTVPLLIPSPTQAQKSPKGKKHPPVNNKALVEQGHTLFNKNCAVCHGVKAQGGEGPDLRGLSLSEAMVTGTIKKGVPGDMPAFGTRLKDGDIKALIVFIRSLKR